MALRIFWDDLRATLWFRPALWIVGLALLALALVDLDGRLSHLELATVLPWLFIEGAEGARTMLGAIGSAMLTVATLAFSIIMLAVVQTANAYSPRLLRQYLGDTTNQHVMGVLIGTFLYTLLVLRVVRSGEDFNFVPTIAVTTAIALSMLSIGVFTYFINHVAHSVEVVAIVTTIQRETQAILDEQFPREPAGARFEATLPSEPGHLLLAQKSGYVEAVAVSDLVTAARRAGGVVRLERRVGEYVLAGTPLATLWGPSGTRAQLADAVRDQVTQDKERTMVQDLAYGINQLSDVALRALSPGINDPSTAINCINVLAALLGQILQRPPLSPYHFDRDDRLRLILPEPTFAQLFDLAFNQIRQYAAHDYACTLRLLDVCAELAYVATRLPERAALWKHVTMVAHSAKHHLHEPWDRADVNDRIQQAAALLGQQAEPLLLDAPVEALAYHTHDRGGNPAGATAPDVAFWDG